MDPNNVTLFILLGKCRVIKTKDKNADLYIFLFCLFNTKDV